MGHLKEFYVYEHWRSDTNQCFYVGKGSGKRAHDLKRNRNQHFKNICAKVVRLGFRIDVILVETGLSEKEALKKEMELIRYHQSNGVELCNQTFGGDGMSGWKPSPETKKKWSQAFQGEKNPMFGRVGQNHPAYGYKHTDEQKKRFSDRMRGEKNPMFGKPSHNNGKPSPLRGTTHSEETRRKRSESLRGDRNPMFGKKISEEARRKMSESHQRRLAAKRTACTLKQA